MNMDLKLSSLVVNSMEGPYVMTESTSKTVLVQRFAVDDDDYDDDDWDQETQNGFCKNDSVQSLSWHNLKVDVKNRKTGKLLSVLENCSGSVKSGQLLALMGPSGSGKTTMLNVLAGRSTLAHTGSVLINDDGAVGSNIQEISSYVQQEDIHIGGLTVSETIGLTSQLASPNVSRKIRARRENEVMKALGLQAQRDTIVASPFRTSLSGGQRRRLSLATALVTNPKLLFLDEPTSGLDSAASHEIIRFVSQLAKRYGLIVVASIHQPSSSTLELFDTVMLITGGKTCYFGLQAGMISYFDDISPIPKYTNPAEFLLSLVNADFCENTSQVELVSRILSKWQSSEENKRLSAYYEVAARTIQFPRRQRATIFQATWILLRRNFIKSYRDPLTYGTRLAINIALAVVIGTVWLRLSYSQASIQPFINCIFFSSAFMSLMSVAYAPPIIEDIRMLEKEYANRLYTPLSFVLANFIIGLPWLGLAAVTFSVIVYWVADFANDGVGFATFVMWLYVDLIAAESLVVLVSAVVPHFVVALAFVAFANGLWLAVGGFLVPMGMLNAFWKYAFHYIDFQAYVFKGLMANQFKDTKYTCDVLKSGAYYCMYQSDLAKKGQIRGTAVLEAYQCQDDAYKWLEWLGISLAIIFAHRLAGYLILCWRVRTS